ncbi:hypothetical protein V7659_31895, partial [Neobacillus drentensis]|uniref:hypothetical protein n=1 Tax=Neobacillus drentensis TaxID=220684 RepID=UPI0030000045
MPIKDMTYNEINQIKAEINSFMELIKKNFYEKSGEEFLEIDNSFFRNISKHIMFFKFLLIFGQDNHFINTIISDFYYLILSIIKGD